MYADMRLASAFVFVLLAACSSEQSSTSSSLTRDPYSCSDVEVHVIGTRDVNPGDGGGGGSGGSTVILSRPGHHILVLSSYAANTWNVQVQGSDVHLDGVYAVGHEPQKVIANVKTQINLEDGVDGGADANGYRYPSTATAALLKLTSIRIARHATSFHGCFAASKWVIGENMATTSDCADGSYTQYDTVLDCDGDNTCGTDGDGDGDTGDGSGDGSLY